MYALVSKLLSYLMWNTGPSPIKVKNKAVSHYFSYDILEVFTNSIKQEKMIRGIKILNEELKWYVFTDDMIEYLKNTKKSMNNTNTNNRHFN